VREAGSPVPQIDPASGERLWIVARYQDVLDGLRHPDIGHEVHRHRPGAGERRAASEVERIGARQLIDLDPPDHTRLRKLVSTASTPRTVARLESRVATIVDGLIAAARRREVIDAVADLGEPMPVAVIADLIGVPQADRRRFRAWSATIMSGRRATATTQRWSSPRTSTSSRRGAGHIRRTTCSRGLSRSSSTATSSSP